MNPRTASHSRRNSRRTRGEYGPDQGSDQGATAGFLTIVQPVRPVLWSAARSTFGFALSALSTAGHFAQSNDCGLSATGVQDVADVGVGAVGRVEVVAAFDECLDLCFQSGELTSANLDSFELGLE